MEISDKRSSRGKGSNAKNKKGQAVVFFFLVLEIVLIGA